MKTILLGLLYSIARQYFDKDLFERVQILVTQLMDRELAGDVKRNIVREAIKKEWYDVSTITVDTIIQMVLLKFKGQ